MKALWLDLSDGNVRVWLDNKLAVPTQGSGVRLGIHRDVVLLTVTQASASAAGWLSMPWETLHGKLPLPADFWPSLEASRWPVLEDHPQPRIAPLGLEFEPDAEVIFFAGTFDPWHAGHQACVDLATPHLPLVLCPDRNPHKPLRAIVDVTEGYLRLRAQVRATPWTFFYPGFLLKDGTNPTESWVHRLKLRRPDLRVSLLMGHDSFAGLPGWTRASLLVRQLAGLYVVPRGESAEERSAALAWVREEGGPPVHFLAHHPHEALSSSQLRK